MSLQQTFFIPAFLPKAPMMFVATGRSSDFPDFRRPSHPPVGEQWLVAPEIPCRMYDIGITATGIAPDLHRFPF